MVIKNIHFPCEPKQTNQLAPYVTKENKLNLKPVSAAHEVDLYTSHFMFSTFYFYNYCYLHFCFGYYDFIFQLNHNYMIIEWNKNMCIRGVGEEVIWRTHLSAVRDPQCRNPPY